MTEHYLTAVPFTSTGERVLARASLVGDALSCVRTSVDLAVAHLGTEPALDKAHAAVPWAHGVVWPSPVDVPRRVIALFADRCPAGALAPASVTTGLDGADGAALLSELLEQYHVQVPPPDDQLLVFLNYRSADTLHAARMLHTSLCERFGEPAVFMDDRSIGYGVDFAELIKEKVRRAKVLVALIGTRWEDTYDERGDRLIVRPEDWVRFEIAEALANNVMVVPILVGVRPALTENRLPDELRALVNLQYSHLRQQFTRADVDLVLDELVEDIPVLRAHARPRGG